MSKALIIVHDGYTDSEGIYAYDRCREEGIEVHVATPTGNTAKGEKGWDRMKADMSTQGAWLLATQKIPASLSTTKSNGLWDLLILPGGVKSIEKVRQDSNAIDLIKLHSIGERIIATMCHGAQLLIEAELVRNRKVSGYYSIKTDIINAGGEYVPNVTMDGNIISAPHYDFNGKWMGAVIKKWQDQNGSTE